MKKHRYAIETVYKGYRFRSRLEAKWAYFFDQIGVKYQYEVEGYELPGTRYLPDFLLTLRGYAMDQNIFVEIKPYYPLKEDQYKAQWLAHYTRTPVYIFFGQFGAPEPEEISAIRFSPIQINLKLLSHTSLSNGEAYNSNSIYLPKNIYLDLLQFYRIGCQLMIETDLNGEMKIGCLWENETKDSSSYISIEETIEVLHLYDEMKNELKQVLTREIATFLKHSNMTNNKALPLRFLLQFVEEPDSRSEHKWVSCASCKHVGIYPDNFSHGADCLVNYVKDDKGGFIEPDEPDEENFQKRQSYYFNKSDMIQRAYEAARSIRFEFGENP